MEKCLIYYTNNRVGEPIFSAVQSQLEKSGLPVVSVSLKPIKFGKNIVLEGESGPFTMLQEIMVALSNSSGKYVFFCEHDVLYPKSHFDFTPPRDDIFYYNENVWRWDYPHNRVITYDRLFSLSSLCVNLEFAIDHYLKRMQYVIKNGWYKDNGRDPSWARIMGFEPGTKKKKRGGFSDDDFATWRSKEPIIDIRHNRTYSKRKCNLSDFKHLPTGWREATLEDIGGAYGLKHTDTKQK